MFTAAFIVIVTAIACYQEKTMLQEAMCQWARSTEAEDFTDF